MNNTNPEDFMKALYSLAQAAYDQGHGVDSVMQILAEQGVDDERFRIIVEEIFIKINNKQDDSTNN